MIVQNSMMVFNTIKWAGVFYLIILGIKNWRYSITDEGVTDTDSSVSLLKQFSLGWATGMSNPKSILVFTVLFPQFINPAHYTSHFVILAVSFFIIQGSSAVAYACLEAKRFYGFGNIG